LLLPDCLKLPERHFTNLLLDRLTDGGRIEAAQRMARQSNASNTSLQERRDDDIGVGEVEPIGT
jgi:hypothetical protein